MPKTIQCPHCGVVLTLPENTAGKRLKCPQCATKFVANEADAKHASTISAPEAGLASMIKPGPGQSRAGREKEPDLPTSPGDLRETFDLSMMTGEAAPGPGSGSGRASQSQVGDALALFQDQKPEPRRPSAAEARSRPRRCPTCGGVVPAGMSLCSSCGLDLESGTRIDLSEDFMPEVPTRPSGIPLGIAILGGICALGSLILFVAALTQWYRGLQGAQFLSLICLFSLFASVQFLRRKSIKLLLVALSLGAMIDILALIALPLYQASSAEPMVAPAASDIDDPDAADVLIPSFAERLNASGGTERIELGIAILAIYSGVTIYLLSPTVNRQFHQ